MPHCALALPQHQLGTQQLHSVLAVCTGSTDLVLSPQEASMGNPRGLPMVLTN